MPIKAVYSRDPVVRIVAPRLIAALIFYPLAACRVVMLRHAGATPSAPWVYLKLILRTVTVRVETRTSRGE